MNYILVIIVWEITKRLFVLIWRSWQKEKAFDWDLFGG